MAPGNTDVWLPAQLARRGRTWNANRAGCSLESTLKVSEPDYRSIRPIWKTLLQHRSLATSRERSSVHSRIRYWMEILSFKLRPIFPWWKESLSYTRFRWRNLKERDHLGDPGVDRRVILRWIFSSGVPRGVCGAQPPPPKFRRPSKIVPNSTRLWKLSKIAEFRTPTPQDVRKKGSKILKLPRFAIVLH